MPSSTVNKARPVPPRKLPSPTNSASSAQGDGAAATRNGVSSSSWFNLKGKGRTTARTEQVVEKLDKGSVVKSFASLPPRQRLYLSLGLLVFASVGLWADGHIMQEPDVVSVVPKTITNAAAEDQKGR